MRLLILLAVLILNFGLIHAQDYEYEDIYEQRRERNKIKRYSTPKTAFFEINLNAALPMGNYGAKDLNRFEVFGIDTLYFATTGVDLNIGFGKYFTKTVGIYVKGGYIRNGTDYGILSEFQFVDQQGNEVKIDFDFNGYHHLYATGGLLLTAHIGELAVDFKALAGIAYGIYAGRTIIADLSTPSVLNVERSKTGDLVFMPDLGVDFRYNIKENLALSFNTAYKFADYTFIVDETFSVPGTTPQTDQITLNMPTHIISVGLGVSYIF